MKKLLIIGVVAVAVILFVVLKPVNNGQNFGATSTNGDTLSVAKVATVSSSIFSADPARVYAKCTNIGARRIDVVFGSTASQNWGFPVYASQSFEVAPDNGEITYIGAVTATVFGELGSTSANYGRLNCEVRH